MVIAKLVLQLYPKREINLPSASTTWAQRCSTLIDRGGWHALSCAMPFVVLTLYKPTIHGLVTVVNVLTCMKRQTTDGSVECRAFWHTRIPHKDAFGRLRTTGTVTAQKVATEQWLLAGGAGISAHE